MYLSEKAQCIADYFGKENQIEKLKEEVAELIEAIREGDSSHVAEELADVRLMLYQFAYFFDVKDYEIEDCMVYKTTRTFEKIRRMKKENDDE